MAVDLNLGPHSGGCGTCSGVVTVDAADTSKPYTVRYNSETYSIAHFSVLIPPDSIKVETVSSSATMSVSHLGFTTPQGNRVVQILNENTQSVQVVINDDQLNQCITAEVAAQSLYSFVYPTGSNEEERDIRTE